jgi:hypothetical protein
MTDTSDSVILIGTVDNPQFQERCRLRFLSAALNVTSEVLSVAASAPTLSGSNVLHFASTAGIAQAMTVTNLFSPSTIPVGTIVETVTGTSVTINANVVGGTGVQTGDIIQIAAIAHAQRLAFAGALFRGNVDLKMLAMLVLSSAQNKVDCLANTSVTGGNITDANIDIQVASAFTGLATSTFW